MHHDLPDLTAAQYKPLKKKTRGYWGFQFAACVFFVVLGSAGVVAAWGFGVPFTGDDTAAGDGFMSVLTAAAGAACLVYLLKKYRPANLLGRLRYAWTIRQIGQAPQFRSVNLDLTAIALADKATQGTLTDEELAALQALDPNFPYPWRIPPGE